MAMCCHWDLTPTVTSQHWCPTQAGMGVVGYGTQVWAWKQGNLALLVLVQLPLDSRLNFSENHNEVIKYVYLSFLCFNFFLLDMSIAPCVLHTL